jgi:hypothetical protein
MKNLHIVSGRISLNVINKKGIVIIAIFLFLSGCKRNENIQAEGLYGRWDISRAERNGKETSYLRNGYFIINPDGTMTINITGEDEKGQFTLENNKLTMEEKVFDIKTLQNDSLTIRYDASPNSHFLFYMLKRKDDVQ